MTHKLTRLTALVLSVILAFSVLLVPVSAASFNDVSETAWYKAAVDYVNERGWMSGTSQTSFAPNEKITRAMMTVVLARMAGVETDNDTAAFTDTPAGKWYTGAVAWAAENGIVSGIGNGRFAPNRAITRQDLSVMLQRYAQLMGVELEDNVNRGFSDLNRVSEYALPAVLWSTGSGLISGFEDDTFRAKETATRAQVAQLMMRLDLLIKGEDLPGEAMPAQSFDGMASNGMGVAVEAPEGALPTDTQMTVSAVSDERSLEVLKDLAECGRVLAASNITFTRNGETLQPQTAVQVQLSLTDLQNANNPAVVHLKHDGTLEYVDSVLISTTRSGSEKALSFEATDFSVYAVVDGDTNNDSARLVVKIWKRNEAGTAYEVDKTVMVTRQDVDKLATIIPDGESPIVYGKEIFCGWYVDKANFDGANAHVGYGAEDADGQHTMDAARDSVKDILEDPRFTIKDGVTTVHIYPMVLNYFVVSLVDENGGTTYDTKVIYTTQDSTSYVPQLIYSPFEQGYRFVGWQKDDGDNTIYQNNDSVPITQQKTILRAKVEPGYWLSFNENPDGVTYKGATYNPPVFCTNGTVLKAYKPAAPEVAGYTFDCWCTDQACTQPYAFFQEGNTAATDTIRVPTTLYARYTADATVPYTIIVWKQKVTDAKNAADNGTQKYDYYYSTTYNAAPGTAITASAITSKLSQFQNKGDQTVTVDGQTLDFLGFTYNSSKTVSEDTTIQRKGTTVLNVYYDRQLVTINFHYPTYTQIASSSTTGFGNIYVKVGEYYHRVVNSSTSYSFYEIPRADMKTSTTYYAIDDDNYFRTINYQNNAWYWTGGSLNGTLFDFSEYDPLVRIDKPTYYYQVSYPAADVETFTGLYESTLSDNHYTWPNDNWWYTKLYTGSSYTYPNFPTGTRMTFLDAFVANGTSYTLDLYGSKTQAVAKIYFYQENEYPNLGNYTVKNDPESGSTNFLLSDKYAGFTCYRYSTTSANGPWTEVGELMPYEEGSSDLYYDANPDTPDVFDKVVYLESLHIQFKRNQYGISYLPGKFVDGDGDELDAPVNGTFKVVNGIYFEQDISSYGKNGANYYDPTKAGDFVTQEWVLEGWYDNPECSANALHDFSDEDMPAHNITLYGKFVQVQYRAILHYNIPDELGSANVSSTNGMKESYRVNFNDMIDGGQTVNVWDNRVDPEYILVGWYTDEACTKPFTFSTHLNDATTAPYDKTVDMTDNIGQPDAYNSDLTGYNGGDRFWITRKLDLYAKWRRVMAGADGITIRYDAIEDDDANGDGIFEDQHDDGYDYLWTDPLRYADDTWIMARSASTPNEPNNFKFDHWQIMKPTSPQDPTLIPADADPVFPGQLFKVDMDDAAVNEQTHNLAHVERVEPTCKDGHTEYWYCRRCGKVFWDAEGNSEIMTPTAAYPAGVVLPGNNNHSLTRHEGVEPTCVTGGSVEYWSCSICGKYFSDANGSTEVSADDLAIPATGLHTWGAYTHDSNAHYHECSVCHTTESEVHSFTDTVVAPTASQQGYTRHTCDVCGYSYDDAIVPALGYDYTVTFSVLGDTSAIAPMTSNTNTGITLPTCADIGSYTFRGWVTSAINTPTDQAPTVLSGSYTAPSDITLYAVYSYTDEGLAYQKITAQPSTWVGDYVITYGDTASGYVLTGMNSTATYQSTTSNGKTQIGTAGITVEDDKLYNVADKYVFTMASSGSGYTLKNKAYTNYYLYSNSNRLYSSTSSTAWSVTIRNSSGRIYTGSYDLYYSSSGYFSLSSSNYSNATLWKAVTTQITYYTTYIENAEGTDYTVTFSVLGKTSTIAPMTSNTNTGIMLPTATAPEGYEFAGWSTAAITSPTDEQPTLLTGQYIAPSDITLYAVYTYSEPSGTYTYQLAEGPEDGGEYILVDQSTISGTSGYAVGNTIVANNHYLNAVSVTINSDDTCTVSNVGGVLWAAAAYNGGYSFYNEAVGKYMGLDSSEYVYPSDTALAWAYTEQGYLSNQIDSAGYYYLGYDSENGRFTTNKASGAVVINFYQKVEGTTDYYVTSISGTHVHQLTAVAAVEATCGTPGNIAYWRCVSGCGGYFSDAAGEHQILASSVVIPATGEHTSDNDPVSVSSSGHAEHCTVCNASMNFAEHDDTDVRIDVEATETTPGTRGYYCSVCGYRVREETIPATGGGATEEVSDTLTVTTTGINTSSTSYQTWSGKTGNSGAVYAGKTARGQSTSNPSIQLRYNNSDSGIITTTSGGKITKVAVTWNSYNTTTRTLNIYGKNTAYSSPSELFDASTKGTLIGTIVSNSGTLEAEISGDYAYVGVCSSNGALYLDSITFTWETASGSGSVTEPTRGVTPSEPVTAATTVWVPTDTITAGTDYLIGLRNGDDIILAVNYNAYNSSNHYYKNFTTTGTYNNTSYTDTYHEGYAVKAVVDPETGYVTGVNDSSVATNLDYCAWKFSSSTGGTITSSYESSRYLYFNQGHTSNGGNYDETHDIYPATSSSTWTWNSSSKYLRSAYSDWLEGYAYLSLYVRQENGVDTYYLDYVTNSSSTGASNAGQIQLYKKVTAHTLTVNYAAVGGTPTDLPETYTVQVPEGSTYTAPVPTIEGFTPDLAAVTGTMGTSDVTVTVTYYRDGGSWKWVPTDSIVVGEEYLIGFEVGGNVYLILSKNTNNPVGSSNYYYMPTTYSGYTVLATRDEHGNVTGCSGWTNALDYCQWSFSGASGGTITSVMETGYKLGVYADAADLHATSSTSAVTNGWVWNASDNTLSIPVSSTVTKYASYKATETYSSTTYNNFCTAATSTSQNTKVVLYSQQYFIPSASHTVTFWDDYTDSEISHESVNDGEGVSAYPTAPDHTDEHYVFTGWDTPLSDLEHIYADVVVTAQYEYSHAGYYTVVFKNWNGEVLPVVVDGQTKYVQEVAEGEAAVAPATNPSRPPLEFKGWDHDFSSVTQNLEIRPIFGTAVTTEYLITLRAVYSPIVPLEKTHVTWYANNGSTLTENDPDEVYKNSTEVVINNAIDIEDSETWTYLTKTGYTFLGWARMPEMESMVEAQYADKITLGDVADVMPEGATEQTYTTKIVAYEGLTPNDLWLVYHPAPEGAKAGEESYFTVREKVVDEDDNVTYVELTNSGNANNAFEHIAANENSPYHGLYAVWQRDVFYVLHSSDGKLEAVSMPVGTGEASQGASYAIGTADLTSFVRPGYLYGGYYTDANNDGYAYGYVEHADVQAIADSYSNAELNGWSNVASTASVSTSAVIGTNNLHDTLPTIDENKNFINYTGAGLYTNGTNKAYVKDSSGQFVRDSQGNIKLWPAVWNGADAAQADGTNLRPQVGKVYYLKEVAPQYLTSRMLYTYDTDNSNDLLNVWIFTLLDDANYKCDNSNTGFYVNSGSAATSKDSANFQKKEILSTSFMITQQASDLPTTDPNYHPAVTKTVNAATFGREGGVVMATQMTSLTGADSFTMLPTWTTPDSVKIYNNGLTFTKNSDTSDGENLYTWARSFDGTEKMYFNLNGNHGMGGEDEWKDYAAQIVHFVGPNGVDDDVRAYEIGSTGVFAISVPAGNWTEFLLVRCDSGSLNADFSNMWNNGVKWNQTGNIPIPNPSSGYSSYVNYLTDFTAGGTTGTWSYYPSNPS